MQLHSPTPLRPDDHLVSALLSVFTDGLLVCDADGTVLLHNEEAARLLAKVTSSVASASKVGEASTFLPDELAGQSVFNLLDEHLLTDALTEIRDRIDQGAQRPQAVFATTVRADEVLRVHVVPVLDARGVIRQTLLLLRAVRQWEHLHRTPDQLVQKLIEGFRAPLASMRAAIETIAAYPDMEEALATQFKHILLEQSVRLSEHLTDAVQAYSSHFKSGWPLENMSGADLLGTIKAKLERELDIPVLLQLPLSPVKVRVDSYSLIQGLVHLATLVKNAVRPSVFTSRMHRDGPFVWLDLVWEGEPIRPDRLRKWEVHPLVLEGTMITTTLREIVERHDAEMWSQAEKDRKRAYIRFLFPKG